MLMTHGLRIQVYEMTTAADSENDLMLINDSECSRATDESLTSFDSQSYRPNFCQSIKRHFPIVRWLPKYSCKDWVSDLVAGITVGLTVIPQGIAYASIAGLPLQYGLYSSFVGSLVYIFMGSTKQMTIGPAAILALMTAPHVARGGIPYAITLTFVVGCVIFLLGIFKLGFLIDFLSTPVISAFCSGAALIIASTQFKGLLGLKFNADTFVDVVREISQRITRTNFWDLALGVVCIAVLLCLKIISNSINETSTDADTGEARPGSFKRLLLRFLWLITISRNAIVVVLASVFAYVMVSNGHTELSLTESLNVGLPSVNPPSFSVEVDGKTINFFGILSDFGVSIFLVSVVAIMDHVAVAKAFNNGKPLDVTQELLCIGISNIIGSFFGSFAVTGSFSRSALNYTTGVRSPLGGVYTAAIVLFALAVLAKSFHYIPKAALSAIIITAVFVLVDFKLPFHLWKTRKMEFLIYMCSFVSCITLGAEYGIAMGMTLSIILLLYNVSKPPIFVFTKQTPFGGYILVKPNQTLFFPAAEHLRDKITEASRLVRTKMVVFDGSGMYKSDYTVASSLNEVATYLKATGRTIVFAGINNEVTSLLNSFNSRDIIFVDSLQDIDRLNVNGVNGRAPEYNTFTSA